MRKIDTAMILAAGYGTRLKPFTDKLPKALVEYKGKPMIESVIEKLEVAGIKNIIINTHHHHDKMVLYFKERKFSSNIQLIYEEEILGTGGAIKNAEKFLSRVSDFLVYNTDVDCDIDLNKFEDFHFSSNSMFTLAVQNRVTKRFLLTGQEGELLGRMEDGAPVFYYSHSGSNSSYGFKAFCGIQIINSSIFDNISPIGKAEIIPVYMSMLKQGVKIITFDISDLYWKDLGKPENL